MITDDDILDALDEVDEDELETFLCESDCFHTSLAKAIVKFAVFDGELRDVSTMLNACYMAVRERQRELAEKVARDKDDARRFSAETKDDFDDWHLNAEMGRKVA